MNIKPRIKLSLRSRRVVIHDYAEPLQHMVAEVAPPLTRSSGGLELALVAAQPFAQPARPKLQRSQVLARRPVTKRK